jgi:hypothetical protein
MPAIRAILLEGGSPGRSSGGWSAWSGGAGSVTATPSLGDADPPGLDVPKTGQKRSREGYLATFGATVRRIIHTRNTAQTDRLPHPIALEHHSMFARDRPDSEALLLRTAMKEGLLGGKLCLSS